MWKVTVLYGHPTNAEDFEKYYAETHLPLASRMKGLARVELTRFVSGPDGGRPPFYRMAELYFPSQTAMRESMGSPEGQATAGDIASFATGGATMLIGSVEP